MLFFIITGEFRSEDKYYNRVSVIEYDSFQTIVKGHKKLHETTFPKEYTYLSFICINH